jgi:hypothetical protein
VGDLIDEKMNSRIRREIITSQQLQQLLSNSDYNGSIVGSGSLFSPRHQTSYVLETEALNGYPLTAPAVARAIIEKKLRALGRKTYPRPKDWEGWELHSHPLYCKPAKGEFTYLDIKGAFLTLYSKLPAIPHGTTRGMNCAPPWLAEFLPADLHNWKLVRNSLVGVWRSCTVTRLSDGGLSKQTRYFPTTNYYAWQWIQKALHYFAGLALQHGAIYIYSDGYIFPLTADFEGFQEKLASLGIETKEKARGKGEVRAVGSYKIEKFFTKRDCQSREYSNIIRVGELESDLIKLTKFNPYSGGTNALI